jgi:hypothetical protein
MTLAPKSRPSESRTRISVASFTTWLLVRMNPRVSRRNPEPSDAPRNPSGASGSGPGRPPKNRSKKSSKSSLRWRRCGGAERRTGGCLMVVMVEMFTTEGRSRSTSGASEDPVGTASSASTAWSDAVAFLVGAAEALWTEHATAASAPAATRNLLRIRRMGVFSWCGAERASHDLNTPAREGPPLPR